jgi:hypothetical protein
MKKTETTPVAEVLAAPTTKSTPVEERKYALVESTAKSFKGKQRQIVFDILLANQKEMTIDEIAAIAEEKGLRAIGGVVPSCRYHLHHLTKDGVTKVTNPTITVE